MEFSSVFFALCFFNYGKMLLLREQQMEMPKVTWSAITLHTSRRNDLMMVWEELGEEKREREGEKHRRYHKNAIVSSSSQKSLALLPLLPLLTLVVPSYDCCSDCCCCCLCCCYYYCRQIDKDTQKQEANSFHLCRKDKCEALKKAITA